MKRLSPMVRRFAFPICVSALTASLVSGCALEPVPPCPEIRIDSNTSILTKFRPGEGRDITDVMYQAEIISFEGNCRFDDDGVEAVMDVELMVSGGPAVEAGSIDLFYFVAIPRFFPDPAGKKIFNRQYKIPSGGPRRERLTESNVRIFIPLEDKLTAAGYDVYLGFQLTDEQLQYNRQRTQ